MLKISNTAVLRLSVANGVKYERKRGDAGCREERDYCVSAGAEGGEFHIEVRVENETVWLTQAQMAELFGTSRTNIVEHIGHIYEENELDLESTCRKF